MTTLPPPKATPRTWAGLAVLALPCILASMDVTVLNLAVPELSRVLQPTPTQLLWIVDIYGFMISGSLITMGTLGDRIGRRKLLLWGALFFGLASTLAAFAPTANALIVARGLLGIAGATLAPSTLSLIRTLFQDARERTVAISIWVTCFSFGAAVGPVLGGLLLEHFWWGSVFLLNVPVKVLLLVSGPVILPEYRDPKAGRLDIRSAASSLGAILLLIHVVKSWAAGGFHLWMGAPLLLAFLLARYFVQRQRGIEAPFIDLSLFERPVFVGALSLNIVGCFVAFASFLFSAQYVQLVLGLSPLQAALWTSPTSLAFIVGSLITPRMSRVVSPRWILLAGLVVAAAGFGGVAWVVGEPRLLPLVFFLTLYCFGLSPIFTLATDLVVGSVPEDRAGSAAGISETCNELGGALGMGVMGSIGMAVYRIALSSDLDPSWPASSAEEAVGSLSGALHVAASVPAAEGAPLGALSPSATLLAGQAKAAFAEAYQMVSLLNVLLVLLLAWGAYRLLTPDHTSARHASRAS